MELKGILVNDTAYGNIKKIAETITEMLRESVVDMSVSIKIFIGKVKGEEWADKPFVAFDTENPNMQKKE